MKPSVKIEVEPIAKFGEWSVFQDGTLEKKISEFLITPDRLTEKDFLLNMMVIGENLHDFFLAYMEALRILGIQEITMKTNF